MARNIRTHNKDRQNRKEERVGKGGGTMEKVAER